ncbi:LANO_0G15808g1_1 [Lachancea nothofagi CBS 11611]|uniref:LANO_0G15808g1_1 n=1 Tax=Lachancea nothofagi CBS 11611 TaxID=1266666 RepID=A0A1G4KK90_9SACH|nr:LANO_0G15808g1_1 [Lachancea nothofagi CBS 11611]
MCHGLSYQMSTYPSTHSHTQIPTHLPTCSPPTPHLLTTHHSLASPPRLPTPLLHPPPPIWPNSPFVPPSPFLLVSSPLKKVSCSDGDEMETAAESAADRNNCNGRSALCGLWFLRSCGNGAAFRRSCRFCVALQGIHTGTLAQHSVPRP